MRLSRFLLCVAVLLGGCQTPVSAPISVDAEPQAIRSLERYRAQYVLSAGDALEVVVDRLPEISRSVVIRPDGAVSYPKIEGDVTLQGLTIPQAQELLEARLAERLLDPEVTIIVQNPPPPQVFVAGEVGATTPVPLRNAPTVAAAVAQSGGLLRSAAPRNVVLIRLEETGQLSAYPIDPAGRGPAGMMLALQNIATRPGDLIIVQESNRSQFTRFVNDFINTPLGAFNQLLSPYIQLELLREINAS